MRRPLSFLRSGWLCLLFLVFSACPVSAASKVVIASAGASGYLMEHNLPSVALAVAMEADLIKQDLVLTSDGQVIVFRDPTLERVTNVAELFPGRSREDGRYHVLDFTLDEIRQLSLHDPAGLFPADLHPRLTIPTLNEELAMIRGLEKTLQRTIPIAPEIKQPWLYRKEGHDISQLTLTILRDHGYTGQEDNVFILSFDAEELQRLANELLPAMGMSVKLIQLIDSNEGSEIMVEEWGELVSYNYDWMFSKSGLRSLKGYAAGIGLNKSMLADDTTTLLRPNFVEDAHQLGMFVYTLAGQKEAQPMVPFVNSLDKEFDFFYFTVGVDGIVTDFCGEGVRFLKNRSQNALPAPEKISTPALGGEASLQLPLSPQLPQQPDRENLE
ncbi:MAG: glycerophosphodiester phosphodiesterase [Proteobacteria bacterium]|nr:glycerophosphodiester phosphodiesterase [Pseudomonadota bacterium]MBU1418812.1 glycerophosphodiester phosphodiesterase [Pseudomonadota bacterium]MBU1453520.1 glycerophosphodiester phosphodiesterase [Pseudomonadota bacterium]